MLFFLCWDKQVNVRSKGPNVDVHRWTLILGVHKDIWLSQALADGGKSFKVEKTASGRCTKVTKTQLTNQAQNKPSKIALQK